MSYLIITKKKWQKSNFKLLLKKFLVNDKLNFYTLKRIKPKIIFFIFWSSKIPKNVYENYLCIQFHSSDLPNFRGGSPIQNQILKGVKFSKISAFRVNSKIDGGDICLKEKINLIGSAKNIFLNIEKKIIKMIIILSQKKQITFYKQKGKGSYFKRREENASNLKLNKIKDMNEFYNLIRCTDAKGYPFAFINFKNFKIEFFDAKLKKNKIDAKIKIS